jgi:GMP synthase (glutamine-hydrolysing)
MILVMDNEVDPELRYLGPELVRLLPEAEYHVYPEEPVEPAVGDLDGVVLSGSTASVYDADHADWIAAQASLLDRCLTDSIPLLGICFGHQLVNHALGGTVEADRFRGGFVRLRDVNERDPILRGVGPVVPVVHGDVVVSPGEGMVRSASTDYSEYFCTRHETAPVWTVQFHPELTREVGAKIDEFDPGSHSFADTTATRVLDNFAERCGLAPPE